MKLFLIILTIFFMSCEPKKPPTASQEPPAKVKDADKGHDHKGHDHKGHDH